MSGSNLAGGSGPVSITGQGSLFGGVVGQYNQGIYVVSANVTSSGAISLTGTGGTGTSYNNGMQIQSAILTAGGLLTLTGSGNTGTTGTMNIGVQITNPCTLMGAGGSAIDGTGGNGTSNNHGVFMNAGVVTSLTLADITGTAGAGTGSLDEAGTYF